MIKSFINAYTFRIVNSIIIKDLCKMVILIANNRNRKNKKLEEPVLLIPILVNDHIFM